MALRELVGSAVLVTCVWGVGACGGGDSQDETASTEPDDIAEDADEPDATPQDSPGDVPLKPEVLQGLQPCGAITPDEVSALVTQHVQALGSALIDRSLFINDSQLLHALLETDASEPLLDQESGHESLAELVDELSTTVFVEGNLDASTDSSVTYLLRPDVRCPDPVPEPDWDEFDLEDALEDQQACKDAANESQTRLEVSRALCDQHTDALMIRTTVKDERLPVAQMLLRADGVLSELELEHLFAISGTQLEASGSVLQQLELDSTSGYQLVVSSPGFAYNSTDESLAGGLEADGDQRLELSVDGAQQGFSGSVALANWKVLQGFESFISDFFVRDLVPESALAQQAVVTSVPKLAGKLGFELASDSLSLSGASLGDSTSTMRLDQMTLVAIDLNPDAGRQLDAVFSLADDGAVNVSVPAASVLRLTYQLQPVADQVDGLQTFAGDDVVELAADSGTVGSLLINADGQMMIGDETELGPQLRIDAGAFSMSSQTFPEADLSVQPGMCLWQLESVERQHEMFGDMAAQTCQ